MMRVYFDSSAWAKRYIDEAGTDEVLEWCEQASELALSVIAIPEVISAFRRLLREGRLRADQYSLLEGDLLLDVEDTLVCDTIPEVIGHAVRALESHVLRAMDAIHIGAAVACSADAFVSADARQCAAARALGLRVAAL